jgi:hypothetical protein
MQEFNSHYQTHSRRTSASQPPLVVNRVKVTFQNEPGKKKNVCSVVDPKMIFFGSGSDFSDYSGSCFPLARQTHTIVRYSGNYDQYKLA